MQIKIIHVFILFFSVSFTCSCIEEYTPEIDDYDNQLVVDGLITNYNEPYTIKLSKTSPLNNPEITPFEGANVAVEDSEGNIHSFPEIDPGIYQNDEFTGQPGTSYRVLITTTEGKIYQSSFQQLLTSVPIDSVYAEIEYKPTSDPNYDEIGYQFYVSTHDPENTHTYYLWRLEETYKFNSDYTLEYTYNGSIEPYPWPMEFYTCWATKNVEEIFLFDASTLNSVTLQNIPLNYVNTETKKLTIKYSLLTNQYTINEETYNFFKAVKEINAGGELFYSTQPYQIKGNIECISNPNEKVLGLFWVAGKTAQRIFVNRPLLVSFYYDKCTINTQGVPFIGNYSPSDWPIYLTINEHGDLGIVGRGCVDCTQKDGSLEKPNFWIDN